DGAEQENQKRFRVGRRSCSKRKEAAQNQHHGDDLSKRICLFAGCERLWPERLFQSEVVDRADLSPVDASVLSSPLVAGWSCVHCSDSLFGCHLSFLPGLFLPESQQALFERVAAGHHSDLVDRASADQPAVLKDRDSSADFFYDVDQV